MTAAKHDDVMRGGAIGMPEVIRGLLSARNHPECGVELTLNAKGDVQIAVSWKGSDLVAGALLAETEFDRLCVKYPRSVPTDTETALQQARKATAIQANRAKGGKTP